MLEDFLPLVTKPARYINTEINAVHKDLSRVKTKICLLFPDAYEVGMSHLGLRILYHVLNKREDTACERVFSPWTDYEEKLRASGRPLTSLESNLPLARFDLIGITLQYELSYTNILTALDLARLPLRSSDRNDAHPVIIAGGPCAVNPGPLSDFIDVFFIGEAEEAVHELIDLKQQHAGRAEYLEALSKREGFYVPSISGSIARRRHLKSIDASPYPDKPLLPLLKPIHDRVTVEVARGCIRGCRFCQAGIIYRPYRERGPERIKDLLHESLLCTGYEELSLASLSTGDYSGIQPLVIELMKKYHDGRVSVSLPSLRVGTLTPPMIRAIAGTRKTGFTLAPEAGTERLRRVINKPIKDADLLEAAETIFRNGWSVLKLYFMIGLPTETNEDLDGIIKLVHELLALGKRSSKRFVQLNVSVSTFVPKPHTPFQWMAQATIEDVRAKQTYLEKGLRKRGIALKLHNPETSLLEGAFARGDQSLGKVIEEAVRLGCRFDGWSECFDFAAWTAAFEKFGLNASTYACRQFGLEEELPWDNVKSGVTKDFLKREWKRAEAAETTGNCRESCEHCGIGCTDGGSDAFGKTAVIEGGTMEVQPVADQPAAVQDITTRVRLNYTKTGRIRYLSHLDFMTMFHRAVVRAGVPIAFSQGFNPHPRMAFGPALSVGMESESEYLDMETDPFVDLLKLTRDLNNTLPQGVRILETRIVPKKAPSLSGSIGRYVYEVEVPEEYSNGIEERALDFLAQTSVIVTKEGKQKEIRPGIESLLVSGPVETPLLNVTLRDHEQLKPRVQDVLEQLFCIGREQSVLFRVRRTGLYFYDKDQWVSPMDV